MRSISHGLFQCSSLCHCWFIPGMMKVMTVIIDSSWESTATAGFCPFAISLNLGSGRPKDSALEGLLRFKEKKEELKLQVSWKHLRACRSMPSFKRPDLLQDVITLFTSFYRMLLRCILRRHGLTCQHTFGQPQVLQTWDATWLRLWLMRIEQIFISLELEPPLLPFIFILLTLQNWSWQYIGFDGRGTHDSCWASGLPNYVTETARGLRKHAYHLC